MLSVSRRPLTANTDRTLSRRQTRVNSSEDPQLAATKSWKEFRGKARSEILEKLREMASGRDRCMYCEDSMGTDIDHFKPKALFPEDCYSWDNHLLACSHCNSNQKRDEFPTDDQGAGLLLNPAADNPVEHLRLSPLTGLYTSRTARGLKTIEVLGLNRDTCAGGRRDAWTALIALVGTYETATEDERNATLSAIKHHPFQGVRAHLSEVLGSPNPGIFLSNSIIQTLYRNPELLS